MTPLSSPSVAKFGELVGPILFLYRASIDNNFISENGIVAVLGDEDQVIARVLPPMNYLLLGK